MLVYTVCSAGSVYYSHSSIMWHEWLLSVLYCIVLVGTVCSAGSVYYSHGSIMWHEWLLIVLYWWIQYVLLVVYITVTVVLCDMSDCWVYCIVLVDTVCSAGSVYYSHGSIMWHEWLLSVLCWCIQYVLLVVYVAVMVVLCDMSGCWLYCVGDTVCSAGSVCYSHGSIM